MTGRYAQPGQFAVVQKDGMTLIEREHDTAFRRALMEGCPPQIRPKMHEALAVLPLPGAAAHSKRYFGTELDSILKRTAPLIDEIEVHLLTRCHLSGFKNWLQLTGFANDYRMIKAMVAWADMGYAREAAEAKDKEQRAVAAR